MNESESARRILHDRAVALARRDGASAGNETIDVVAFERSGEWYAIESAYVDEVRGVHHLTPVPGTPDFVVGIMNLRGRILSVVDVGKLFDLPERGLTEADRVVVISNGEMEFGLLASGLTGRLLIERNDISPLPVVVTGLRRELICGVTVDGRAILDGSRLLTDERLIVRDPG